MAHFRHAVSNPLHVTVAIIAQLAPFIQVNGGRVQLINKTVLADNVALSGSSIYLNGGAVEYTLPAPPGRWLFIRQGLTFALEQGPENSDFPFSCPAGVVGGVTPVEQSGPQCSSLW